MKFSFKMSVGLKIAVIISLSCFAMFSTLKAQTGKNNTRSTVTKKTGKVGVKNLKKSPILEAESTNSVPVKVRSCKLEDDIVSSGKIEPKEYSELRSGWSSSIEKIHVGVGDKVKKGQMIALVDTKFVQRQIDFYEGYLRLLGNQNRTHVSVRNLTNERRKRILPLTEKGIMPQSDIEALDRELLSIESMISQTERQIEGYSINLKELLNQERKANFYSPIDGIVTYIIADPKSIVGRVEARGQALVARIDRPGNYLARAFLTDTQRVKVNVGDVATVRLPDQSSYEGKVSFISPIAVTPEEKAEQPTVSISTYRVDVVFSRSGPILPGGLNSQVTFQSKEQMSARCIPWNAIEVVDGKSMLKFFDDDSGWTVQEVQLGRRGRYFVELVSELPEGSVILSRLW